MQLKHSDLHAFLSGKLSFKRGNNRHVSYELPPALGVSIPGVLPINLQHGRGDVANHIVRQVQNFFGLDQFEFTAARKCKHSAQVIFLSMITNQLERLIGQAESEPIVYSRNLPIFAQCIADFLDGVNRHFNSKLHANDRKVLLELESRLQIVKDSRLVAKHTNSKNIIGSIELLRNRVRLLLV